MPHLLGTTSTLWGTHEDTVAGCPATVAIDSRGGRFHPRGWGGRVELSASWECVEAC